MDDIKRLLSSALNPSDVETVSNRLAVLGAECVGDLKYLDVENELSEVLPVLKRRRVAACLGSEFGSMTGNGLSMEAINSAEVPAAAEISTALSSSVTGPSFAAVVVNSANPSNESMGSASGTCCNKNISIMDALDKHPEKESIMNAMSKPVADDRLHRAMIKAACSHLLDVCGRYPPPEHQLLMAVNIVRTFPHRACKSGKGHEMYYCVGSAKGFITNRLREIYRRYPANLKKYKARQKRFETGESGVESLAEDEYNSKKVKLCHLVSSDRTESEIIGLTRETLERRQLWIRSDNPTAADILHQFPRFTDTPNLISQEFEWCHPDARQNTSVHFETVLVPQILKHCRSNGLCGDVLMNNNTTETDPDTLILMALKCLVILLPTTGKSRVPSSVALRYIYEDVSDSSSSCEDAVRQQQDENTKLTRTQPYLLKFGQSLFVMIDSLAVVVKPFSVALAVDILLKSFFVFNVHYPRQTNVVHNFLVHSILQLKSNLTPKAMKLGSELLAQEQ